MLPAVLKQDLSILDRPGLAKYRGDAARGTAVDPYRQLPAITLPGGSTLEAVRGGTGAITAYEDMLFGEGAKDSDYKAAVRDLLLQYCELETAAMVMIWERWRSADGSQY